ncbi:uncharacterized protein K460DRAFT_97904 [Cucurbitaria berberidis CBS 394.84]|uniref:Uncharacterized protein n=1 Tax=Cucurbitaria berberidis CBS 394.84 TaxID=1168544 RepID=A0A9P4GGI1_9PLEO|nr:uncharacterized protein K460DRAFT_97904 [Cucurbitaria berberidis CBS 394.84]KAF1844750.1 hypothetical protein K460DRAFT_97904 [Cucurbitaria berberidis CBS 394.84]
MHFELVLASLAAFAAAVPVEMAHDGSYGSYAPYAGYNPYSSAVEQEAAKMQNEAMNMKRDGNMGQASDIKYLSYTPYALYGPYSAAVDSAAAMMEEMDKATKRDNMMMDNAMMATKGEELANPASPYDPMAQEKRDMLMTDSMMLDPMTATATDDMKRDVNHPDAAEMASSPDSAAAGTLPNNWYGKYE